MRTRLVMLLAAVVLAGCGVFLSSQNLGNAALYATVASFFLALLTAAGSLLVLFQSKPKDEAGHGATEDGSSGRVLIRKRTVNLVRGNKNVQTGEGSFMVVNQDGAQHPSPERHRGPTD